jgi:hypothetical protein
MKAFIVRARGFQRVFQAGQVPDSPPIPRHSLLCGKKFEAHQHSTGPFAGNRTRPAWAAPFLDKPWFQDVVVYLERALQRPGWHHSYLKTG